MNSDLFALAGVIKVDGCWKFLDMVVTTKSDTDVKQIDANNMKTEIISCLKKSSASTDEGKRQKSDKRINWENSIVEEVSIARTSFITFHHSSVHYPVTYSIHNNNEYVYIYMCMCIFNYRYCLSETLDLLLFQITGVIH